MAARCTHPKRVKIMTEAGKKFKGGMQWVGAGDAHIYTCGKGEKGLRGNTWRLESVGLYAVCFGPG
jgi:hypothetical protein